MDWDWILYTQSVLEFVTSLEVSPNKRFESSKIGECYDMSYLWLNNEEAVIHRRLRLEGEQQK